MIKQILNYFPVLILGTLFVACNPAPNTPVTIPPTPTVIPMPTTITMPSPTPSPSPTPLPSPTPEPAITPTGIIPSPPADENPTEQTIQIPIMPDAISDEASPWGMILSQFLGIEIVSFSTPTSLEVVRDFYQSELTTQGWEWIYTDMGESLVLSRPTLILAQEFKQGDNRLAVVAIDGFGSDAETQATLVMSGAGVSSGELISGFRSLIAGGFDLGPPAESQIQAHAMHFTSNLLQFDHPSNWLPTQLQMTSFQTDTGGNAINILPQPRRCTSNDETCFVNFAFLTRSLFAVPVTIRVYSVEDQVTLETFDAQRWASLVQEVDPPPTIPNKVNQPEDMIETGSVETVEMRSIILKDGTPALQRIYRWRQVALSTPLVGSYILFKNGNALIEFHTDFSQEEWAAFNPGIQEIILGITLAP